MPGLGLGFHICRCRSAGPVPWPSGTHPPCHYFLPLFPPCSAHKRGVPAPRLHFHSLYCCSSVSVPMPQTRNSGPPALFTPAFITGPILAHQRLLPAIIAALLWAENTNAKFRPSGALQHSFPLEPYYTTLQIGEHKLIMHAQMGIRILAVHKCSCLIRVLVAQLYCASLHSRVEAPS